MAAGIFISYRRDESRHAAGRLADDLAQAFGSETIFRDIEGIEPGLDFTQSLEKALRSCVVMLVLIGPRWLDIRDGQGQRRLDQPGDWIRQEIASALERDVRVIPVLLEGATLPEADQLPADLQPLVRRQAFDMADGRWRGDLQRLAEALARVPGLTLKAPAAAPSGPATAAAPAPALAGRAKPMLVGAALGVVGLLAVGIWLSDLGADDRPLDFAAPAAGLPVVPAQGAALPAPDTPDVTGLWRTNTGETYHFEQDGLDVHLIAEAGGQEIGQGHGRFDGSVLKLAMTMTVNGVALGTANCDMHPAPDRRSFTGMCQGPNGAFPAQFFR